MSMPFYPSAAQIERLATTAEEAAEVQQVIGKILRHGWRSEGHCNRIALEHELGDLLWAIRLLIALGDLDAAAIERFATEKPAKALPYIYHAENRLGLQTEVKL